MPHLQLFYRSSMRISKRISVFFFFPCSNQIGRRPGIIIIATLYHTEVELIRKHIPSHLISLFHLFLPFSRGSQENPGMLLLICQQKRIAPSATKKTFIKAVGRQCFLYSKQTFPSAGSIKHWRKFTQVSHTLGAADNCRPHSQTPPPTVGHCLLRLLPWGLCSGQLSVSIERAEPEH